MFPCASPFSVLQLTYIWVFWATPSINSKTMDAFTEFTFLVLTLMAMGRSRKTNRPKWVFALKEELCAFHATGLPDTEFKWVQLLSPSSREIPGPNNGFSQAALHPNPWVVSLLKITWELHCCIKITNSLEPNKFKKHSWDEESQPWRTGWVPYCLRLKLNSVTVHRFSPF